MAAYEENLHHVAEPASPSERREARSTTVEDYEGLWLTQALRGYAHYSEEATDERDSIALAYAEYIDGKIREDAGGRVTLYAHTQKAITALEQTLHYAGDTEGEITIIEDLSSAVTRLEAEDF